SGCRASRALRHRFISTWLSCAGSASTGHRSGAWRTSRRMRGSMVRPTRATTSSTVRLALVGSVRSTVRREKPSSWRVRWAARQAAEQALLLQLLTPDLGQHPAVVGAVLGGQLGRVEVEVGLAERLGLGPAERRAVAAVGGGQAQVGVLEEDALLQVLQQSA